VREPVVGSHSHAMVMAIKNLNINSANLAGALSVSFIKLVANGQMALQHLAFENTKKFI
jgi:hypothetical protein